MWGYFADLKSEFYTCPLEFLSVMVVLAIIVTILLNFVDYKTNNNKLNQPWNLIKSFVNKCL